MWSFGHRLPFTIINGWLVSMNDNNLFVSPCVLNQSVSWFARESFDAYLIIIDWTTVGTTEKTLDPQWDATRIQVCPSCSATFCRSELQIKMNQRPWCQLGRWSRKRCVSGQLVASNSPNVRTRDETPFLQGDLSQLLFFSCSLSYNDWSFNSRFKDIWRSGMLRYVSEMALQTWSGFAWHQGRNQVQMSWHVLCHSCS